MEPLSIAKILGLGDQALSADFGQRSLREARPRLDTMGRPDLAGADGATQPN
jgi:hypothetical protein